MQKNYREKYISHSFAVLHRDQGGYIWMIIKDRDYLRNSDNKMAIWLSKIVKYANTPKRSWLRHSLRD